MKSLVFVTAFMLFSTAHADDLTATLPGETSYLIDASAQSCNNKVSALLNPATVAPTNDVRPLYFSYPGMTISWANTKDMVSISKIDIKFRDLDIDYQCTIAGEELASLFFDATNKTSWDGNLPPAKTAKTPSTVTSVPFCRITCGGVNLADKEKSFTSTGTVTVKGIQRSTKGDESPVEYESQVDLINSP